jgi:glucose-6-phosphate dehydrogenase assembly protein OpcA
MAQPPLTAVRAPTVTVLVLAGSEAEAARAGAAIAVLDRWGPVQSIVATDRAVLRSLVDSLARGDLPRVLWWPEGLPPVDEAVLSWVEHLIVDSRTFSGGSRRPDRGDTPRPPDPGLAGLVEIGARLPVTDLAWVDLAPWRELVAGLFDGLDFAPFLGDVRHVRVRGEPSPGRLLAGWLVSRLGLPVTVVEVWAAERVSVEITAEHDGRRAQFSVARSPDSSLIDARATIAGGPSHLRRWGPEPLGTARLLAQALTRLATDPVYAPALAAAVALRPARGSR